MLAPALMVQGTASSVGKSLLVTALCRMFRQDGLRVLPFKAQNMALNSAVTSDGGEIGRAQAVQAEAAGVPSTVDMNPILLKPEGDARSQVVVLGKSIGSMSAVEYHARKPELRALIRECLTRLRSACDLVVIEGAGSPAEINLKDRDIVNMSVAKAADAPVLLVGDIDRGGVFASFVGTMELLDPDERQRVAAFVINKFRGDVSLLRSGLDFLTQRTGVPVLGVVPYVRALRIADEDSVSLEDKRSAGSRAGAIDIAVVRFPRISNYDDVDPLEHEDGVVVRFVERAAELEPADLVILPGSKSTANDLLWLRETGFARRIEERVQRGEPVLGICGGCQMLGRSIDDPETIESETRTMQGLGLLPIGTRFESQKVTAQVRARVRNKSFLTPNGTADVDLTGYEIHMGRSEAEGPGEGAFEIVSRNGASCHVVDGAVAADGVVVGTMIHGLFENAVIREGLLETLRSKKGLARPMHGQSIPPRDGEYDRLAQTVREHLDGSLLRRIARVGS